MSLLVRPWRYRVAPAAGEPHSVHMPPPRESYVIPCAPFYVVGLQRMKQNTPSINQLPQVSFQVDRSFFLHNTTTLGLCSLATFTVRGGALGIYSI